jgi:hypothetical protein
MDIHPLTAQGRYWDPKANALLIGCQHSTAPHLLLLWGFHGGALLLCCLSGVSQLQIQAAWGTLACVCWGWVTAGAWGSAASSALSQTLLW